MFSISMVELDLPELSCTNEHVKVDRKMFPGIQPAGIERISLTSPICTDVKDVYTYGLEWTGPWNFLYVLEYSGKIEHLSSEKEPVGILYCQNICGGFLAFDIKRREILKLIEWDPLDNPLRLNHFPRRAASGHAWLFNPHTRSKQLLSLIQRLN